MKKLIIGFAVGIVIFMSGLGLLLFFLISGSSDTTSSADTDQYGDGQQIVNVALAEEGTIGGSKYRLWYTGRADGAPWCATFISWCADQCGLITANIIPKFQGCNAGVAWFAARDQFVYTTHYGGTEYTPKTGDIIFFAGGYNKNDSTHVGIVQYTQDSRVTTIEGNTSNSVRTRSYSLTDPYILGYGIPEYPSGSDFTGESNAEIAWNFFKSKGCNDYAAAGILGNLERESPGINPTQKQNGGSGIGIAQWTFGESRYNGLVEYASQNGGEWSDLKIQLEYVWYELNGGDSLTHSILNNSFGGINTLKNAKSIEWAVIAFEKSHERAGVPAMQIRIQYAKEFYNQFAGG